MRKPLGLLVLFFTFVSSAVLGQSQRFADIRADLEQAGPQVNDKASVMPKSWVGPCHYQDLPYVGLANDGFPLWGGTFDLPHDRASGSGTCLNSGIGFSFYADVWRVRALPGEVVTIAFAGDRGTSVAYGDYSGTDGDESYQQYASIAGTGSLAGQWIAGWVDVTVPTSWTRGYIDVFVGGNPNNATQSYFLGVENKGGANTASCNPDSTTLCLNESRFKVTVSFYDTSGTNQCGANPAARPPNCFYAATATRMSGDTGNFWFFNAANIELVLKVLDGRGINNRFWVFYGALSNVQYQIRVTDTVTGVTKEYDNPQGTLASVADTTAF